MPRRVARGSIARMPGRASAGLAAALAASFLLLPGGLLAGEALAAARAPRPAADGGDATAVGGDDNGARTSVREGNGRNNRNHLGIGSTRVRGSLHQAVINLGGTTSVQGNLCKNLRRICETIQIFHGSRSAPFPAPAQKRRSLSRR